MKLFHKLCWQLLAYFAIFSDILSGSLSTNCHILFGQCNWQSIFDIRLDFLMGYSRMPEFYLSFYVAINFAFYLTFSLTYILDTLSEIYSGILSDFSGILSGMLFILTYLLAISHEGLIHLK